MVQKFTQSDFFITSMHNHFSSSIKRIKETSSKSVAHVESVVASSLLFIHTKTGKSRELANDNQWAMQNAHLAAFHLLFHFFQLIRPVPGFGIKLYICFEKCTHDPIVLPRPDSSSYQQPAKEFKVYICYRPKEHSLCYLVPLKSYVLVFDQKIYAKEYIITIFIVLRNNYHWVSH